jgi:precorrin-6A/cobalt-precorrin-6A reductase
VILLLGGTSDTNPLAGALVTRGFSVLVSTMTDYPLSLREHPLILKRKGALEYDSLCRLVRERGIVAVVDATHPYTGAIGVLSRRVAAVFKIPYFRFLRPETAIPKKCAHFAKGHAEAARIVSTLRVPVLLTIGSKNLGVYVQRVAKAKIPLIVRVLDRQESINACRDLGIPASHIIAGQGPFSVDDNIAHIHRFNIGVLVTKDSGKEGGMLEKIETSTKCNCALVVVKRPAGMPDEVFTDVQSLVSAVSQLC